jgi:hypothetical protein
MMEKRSLKRTSVHINSTFFYGNHLFPGTVLNLSEKGMFISSKILFPYDAMMAIVIPKEIVAVASVKWGKAANSHHTIGVELLNPSKDYLELVESLRPV